MHSKFSRGCAARPASVTSRRSRWRWCTAGWSAWTTLSANWNAPVRTAPATWCCTIITPGRPKSAAICATARSHGKSVSPRRCWCRRHRRRRADLWGGQSWPPWGRLLGGLDALQSAFLQTKLAMRADAHQFQAVGIRLSVDEDQVGLEDDNRENRSTRLKADGQSCGAATPRRRRGHQPLQLAPHRGSCRAARFLPLVSRLKRLVYLTVRIQPREQLARFSRSGECATARGFHRRNGFS